jgi:NAD(P)-dependent dehydrogenase (short-subunit alcohol dehydrogenase family)
MNRILKDKKILLIGSNSSISKNFAREAINQGATISSIGRKNPNNGSYFIKADVLSHDDLTNAAKKICSKHGNIDVMINFIGTHHQPFDLVNDSFKEMIINYKRVMDLNIDSAFIQTIVFSKIMSQQKQGHIIHLCSNASNLSLYGSYAYNISKHALVGLVKTAATQLAPMNIRVNGIAPGTVETDLNRNMLRENDGSLSARAKSILAHTPTKNFASLDGVTESIIALCFNQRHLTGNIIYCDDGYNVEGHSWPEGNIEIYKNKLE